MDSRYGSQDRGRIWVLLFILLSLGVGSCMPPLSTANPITLHYQTGASPTVAISTPFITTEQIVTATPLATTPPPKRPIYVVDPNDQNILSNIFMIDPDTHRMVWTIQTRLLPEAVLSPDGQRLYVADSYHTQVTRGVQIDALSIYDAHNGNLIADDTSIQGRLLYKAWPLTRDSFMFLSDDGRQLFIEKYGDPDIHQLRLAKLNTATLKTMYEGLLPPCDHRIEVMSDQWICYDNTTLFEINPQLKSGSETTLLTAPGSPAVSVAFDAQTNRLYTIDSNQTVTVVDIKEKTVVGAQRLEVSSGWQFGHDIVLARDGKRLYVSLNTNVNKDGIFIDAIAVYETADWKLIATISLASPIYHFALSAAGDQLYATSPNDRSLAIYDTGSFQRIALMRGLGGTPSLILVPLTAR